MINALYDNFKFWSEKGSVYIISDTHFDDKDCKLMDKNWISPKEQISIINKLVHKNDTLIILGDIGNVEYIKQIKGYKVLIAGNHDVGLSNYKRKLITVEYDEKDWSVDAARIDLEKKYPGCKISYLGENYFFHSPFVRLYFQVDNQLFDEVYGGPLMIGEKLLLSHEPIENINWALNIHGHDHSGRFCNDIYHLNLAANICNFTPISLGEYLKKYGVKKIKSIHRDTIDNATKRKQKRNNKR